MLSSVVVLTLIEYRYTLPDWQRLGNDPGTTAHVLPPDDVILDWARTTLSIPSSSPIHSFFPNARFDQFASKHTLNSNQRRLNPVLRKPRLLMYPCLSTRDDCRRKFITCTELSFIASLHSNKAQQQSTANQNNAFSFAAKHVD
jgi:hypothetical protein